MAARMKKISIPVGLLMCLCLACSQGGNPSPPTLIPTSSELIVKTQQTVVDDADDQGEILFGFFPSPSQPDVEGVIETIQGIGEHGDVILFQENIPWEDFREGPDVDSQKIRELKEVIQFAELQGLEGIFVVDPLNGLNRREFQGLPEDMAGADFSSPQVRAGYLNFALRISREFQPRYLGLASEINTYLDAHPEDMDAFLSLYRETYRAVKAISPDTQVFVTFQWDDLNRLDGDGQPYDIKWDQVENFEPDLDVWAISSYPFFFFPDPSSIPDDYYTPLLERTDKPLAVAEGGWTTQSVAGRESTPEMQLDYLRLINQQTGERLVFWINLTYGDLDWPAYQQVLGPEIEGDDLGTLSNFIYLGLVDKDGNPKPALQYWDQLRDQDQ